MKTTKRQNCEIWRRTKNASMQQSRVFLSTWQYILSTSINEAGQQMAPGKRPQLNRQLVMNRVWGLVTLLQDVTVMHWNCCGVGGSAV